MKKTWWSAALILAFLLFSGFTAKLPGLGEGAYNLKTRTFTIFDLLDKNLDLHGSLAEISDSKPDSLLVDFEPDPKREAKFGSFRFGNNERKIWFLMLKDSKGFWSDFYVDGNADNHLTEKEAVKTLTGQDTVSGFHRFISETIAPVKIRIAYKGATAEFEKNVYFHFWVASLQKERDKTTDTICIARTLTFFDGELKIYKGKKETTSRFRIIDSNGNGCFNDYGKDILMADLNDDGYYRKGEIWPLSEYFTTKMPDGQSKQLRLVVLPYPGKLLITGANQEIDRSVLEPIPEPVPTPEKIEPKETPKPPTSI